MTCVGKPLHHENVCLIYQKFCNYKSSILSQAYVVGNFFWRISLHFDSSPFAICRQFFDFQQQRTKLIHVTLHVSPQASVARCGKRRNKNVKPHNLQQCGKISQTCQKTSCITATIWMSCVGTSRTNPFDLVYLDPPFKSQQDYNVLFAEKD